ncbi:MAG: ABC transporter ATP-binding protein [Solirubrobacteraceae bacterium]
MRRRDALRVLVRPARRWLILGFALTLLSTALSLVQPLLLRALLSGVEDGDGLAVGAILLLVAALVAETVVWSGEIRMLGRGAAEILRTLRHRLAGHLLRLPVATHDELRSDDLVARMSTDTETLRAGLTEASSALVAGTLLAVGSTVLMAILDPLLLAVTLVATAGAGVVLYVTGPKLRDAAHESQEATAGMARETGRALRALRTVKAFGAEAELAARIGGRVDHAYDRGLRVLRLHALITPGSISALSVAYVAVIAVGGTRVASGALSVADFVAFLFYLFALIDPLSRTAQAVVELQTSAGAARRIAGVLALPAEPAAVAGSRPRRPSTPPEIAFDGVSVELGGRPVLRDVSFRATAGARTALVGPSGAGKTTLLGLLERFHHPDAGQIRLGGEDIAGLELADSRALIGYVEQAAPLLDGTIRENLLLGRPDADDAAIQRAVTEADLADVIAALPDGLDTEVGESGLRVSGGQRQRIAVARALVGDPPVLMLDEPTSQVDPISEDHLRAMLDDQRGHRTVLVVAHRLATVRHADHVVVLDHGRVHAQGTHDQLLAISDLYRCLARNDLVKAPRDGHAM